MKLHALFLFCLFSLIPAFVGAQSLELADSFGDAMVLQRDIPAPVWGSAAPSAEVAVSFAGQKKSTRADASGKWQLKLDPLKVSAENRAFLVTSGDEKVELKNVLVGEVWLCSGQSNMEWGLNGVNRGAEEIKQGDHPLIRLRYVNKKSAAAPQTRIDGSEWMVCTPQNLGRGTHGKSFSAVAFLYGLELHKKLNVPVGVIQSAWGGTRIEPWTTPEGFSGVSELKKLAVQSGKASNRVTGLYNAMIHPWVPYAIRGAIWYQGESNLGELDYALKMRALIEGWRAAWQQGDFPFYYVQLAPFGYPKNADEDLPLSWEQQVRALEIPNTGMAIINDIGNLRDIHPRNKHDVAARLARLALSRTYGVKFTDDTGPIYKDMRVEGNRILVEFDHVNSGLAARGGKALTHFEIAGEDGEFRPAQASISGKTVAVSSPEVSSPRHVRFAWSKNAQPNLMNGDKLPASAFRSPPPPNLALGASYVSSSKNGYGFGGTAALTDGSWAFNKNNCYASHNDDAFPKTVTVDLQKAQRLQRVVFGVPNVGSTKTVQVSLSKDGTSFASVGEKVFTQKKAERVTLKFTPVDARYIRLTFPDHYEEKVQYDPNFVFISELEAY